MKSSCLFDFLSLKKVLENLHAFEMMDTFAYKIKTNERENIIVNERKNIIYVLFSAL